MARLIGEAQLVYFKDILENWSLAKEQQDKTVTSPKSIFYRSDDKNLMKRLFKQ
jgi:hypothetical protein